MNTADLPPRLLRSEVCELARYGRAKLSAEIAAGRMPAPVSRGRQSIFDRDAVLMALGLLKASDVPAVDPWAVDPAAIRRAREAKRKPRRPVAVRALMRAGLAVRPE